MGVFNPHVQVGVEMGSVIDGDTYIVKTIQL